MSIVESLNAIKYELYRLIERVDALTAFALAAAESDTEEEESSESDYASADESELMMSNMLPSPPQLIREVTGISLGTESRSPSPEPVRVPGKYKKMG